MGEKMLIKELNNEEDKRQISGNILRSLPNWFGIPESNEEYINKSSKLPFFIFIHRSEVVAFISIKENSKYTAEIYVMGVLPNYHRQGIGKELINNSLQWAKDKGYEFLQVKTLDQSHPDPYYAGTRKFYKSVGFKEFECLPEL